MIITYKQWRDEIDNIKSDNSYDYLTKKRCRRLYGWDWEFKETHKLSVYSWVVEVTFHNPSVESMYRLKWS